MDVLLITDIFGAGDHNLTVLAMLAGVEVRVLCPYDREMAFANEQAAYDAFVRLRGHDSYYYRVHAALKQLQRPTLAIGFSAGGTAAWRALAGYRGDKVIGLLAFYPGQVRHYLQLLPTVPAYLLFAAEQHFSVYEVMQQLHGRVEQHLLPCQHGFMNPRSTAFASAWQRRLMTGLAEVVAGRQPIEAWFAALDVYLSDSA